MAERDGLQRGPRAHLLHHRSRFRPSGRVHRPTTSSAAGASAAGRFLGARQTALGWAWACSVGFFIAAAAACVMVSIVVVVVIVIVVVVVSIVIVVSIVVVVVVVVVAAFVSFVGGGRMQQRSGIQ